MPEDDQFKSAAKAEVDNSMRTDVLGPAVLRVMQDHKPVNDELSAIVAKAVTGDPNVARALNTFIDNHGTTKRGRWVERGIASVIGAIIISAIGLLFGIIKL